MAEKGRLLSQQIQQRQTRTERVIEKKKVEVNEQKQQQLSSQIATAKQKLKSSSSIKSYTTEYNKLPQNVRSFFKTPEQIKKENPETETYFVGEREVVKETYEAEQRKQHELRQVDSYWFKAQTGDSQAQRTLGLEKRYGSKTVRDRIKNLETGKAYELEKLEKEERLEATNIQLQNEQSKIPINQNILPSSFTGNLVSTKLGTFPESTLYPSKTETRKSPSKTSKILKNTSSKVLNNFFGAIKNTGKFYLVAGGSPTSPIISVQPFKPSSPEKQKRTIEAGKLKEKISIQADQRIEALKQEQLYKTGIDRKVRPKFEEKQQKQFEADYGIKISEGYITFEEASERFSRSKKAREIQTDYEAELNKEVKALGFTKTAKTIGAITVAKGFTNIIPTSLGETALYSGTLSAFKYKAVFYPVLIGSATYGTSVALDKTKMPEERYAGLITAGISGTILATRGYVDIKKAVNKPVIKFKNIGKTKTIFDTKPIAKAKQTYKLDKTKVTEYNVAQRKITEVAGRRTEISTWLRQKLNLKPIYKGVPKDKAGYKEASTLLKKYGFKDTKSILKYTQPKIIKETVSGRLTQYQSKSARDYTTDYSKTIEQPIKDIDKTLGIKTRGSTPVKERISSINIKLTELKGKSIFYSKQSVQSPKTFKEYSQIVQLDKRTGVLLNLDRKQGGILKPKITTAKSLLAYKTTSNVGQRQILPRTSKAVRFRTEAYTLPNKPAKIEYFFESPKIQQGIRNEQAIQYLKGSSEFKNFQKIINKMGTVKPTRFSKPLIRMRIENNLNTLVTPKSQPKIIPSSNIPSSNIKSSKQVNAQIVESVFLPQSKLNTNIATVGLESSQKSDFVLSNLIRQIQSKKVKQRKLNLQRQGSIQTMEQLEEIIQDKETVSEGTSGFRSSTVGKQRTRTIKTPQQITPTIIPPINVPSKPVIPKPITNNLLIPFTLKFNFLKQEIKKRKKKKKGVTLKSYFPSFTSRALGLKEEIVTKQQAKKRLNKMLTGGEIRRPLKIRA